MSACFVILESTIAYMISESPLSLDEDQINQLHAAMVGAFNAVLFFLSQCQAHVQDKDVWVRHPLSIVSVRSRNHIIYHIINIMYVFDQCY